ncbi:MAG: hypothetical protein SPC23_01635 [Lachnospiraceae bacterium]|jgi:hypothetical protein|nr:hypothetical protein [Anaerolactibacter massiliensis]MDY4680724.1 hypothetical protein [Lachnospiraceae bacterium]
MKPDLPAGTMIRIAGPHCVRMGDLLMTIGSEYLRNLSEAQNLLDEYEASIRK